MSRKASLVWALAALFAAAPILGCQGDDDPAQRQRERARAEQFLPEPSPALSEALLAALARAKNLHHIADVHLADGDPDRAIAALARILEIEFPEGAPEAEDIRLDARARIAKVLLSQGQLDRALETVEAGIAAATRPSFFVANLHTVKGEIFQAQAQALDATDPERAAAARAAAIVAYEKSNEINAALQKSLMNQATSPEPRP